MFQPHLSLWSTHLPLSPLLLLHWVACCFSGQSQAICMYSFPLLGMLFMIFLQIYLQLPPLRLSILWSDTLLGDGSAHCTQEGSPQSPCWSQFPSPAPAFSLTLIYTRNCILNISFIDICLFFFSLSQCNVNLKRTDNVPVLFIPKCSGSCSVNIRGVKEKKLSLNMWRKT